MRRYQPRTNDPYRFGESSWDEDYPEEDPPPYHYAAGMSQSLDGNWSDGPVYGAPYPEPGSLPPAGPYSGSWNPHARRAAVYQGAYGDSARSQSMLSRCPKCGTSSSGWQGTVNQWGYTGEGPSYETYPRYPNGPGPSQIPQHRCPTCGFSQMTHSQFTGAGPFPAHNVYGPEPFDSFDEGPYPAMDARGYNSQQRYQQRQHQTGFVGSYKANEAHDYQAPMYPHDRQSRANSLYGGAGSSMGMWGGNGVMPGPGSYYHNAPNARAVNSTRSMPFNQYGNESGRW